MSASASRQKRSASSRYAVGAHYSRLSYGQITQVHEGYIVIKNTDGEEWSLYNPIAENELFTSDQFDEEVKCNRTELIEHFMNVRDSVFTVTFLKQKTAPSVAEQLQNLEDETKERPRKLARFAKELLKGEERVLVGYLVQAEPALGRSTVVDLEVENGRHNIRQVDHRTLKRLIVNNTCYSLR